MKIKVRYKDGSEGLIENMPIEEKIDRLNKNMNEVAKIFKDCNGRDPNLNEIQIIFNLLAGKYDYRKPEIVTVIGWDEED